VQERTQSVLAGVVTAVVGFTSSFAVVLAGLRAVGATAEQAASGLLTMCLVQAAGMIWLSWRYRMPITLAWSTPGAALLASTGAVAGGWPAAVGAFVVVGALVVLTAAWPRLGSLVASIPRPLAQAMLAGVLLPLCLAPALSLVDRPALVAPVVATWLVLLRVAPRWAVPGSLVVALGVVVGSLVAGGDAPAASELLPSLSLTTPSLTVQAVVGIALPLYVVTMASQNVPGVAVMASFGYTVPWRPAMAVTGVGTVVGAAAGVHAVNLAAISAALAASPDAGPDPSRRWRAAQAAGWTYVVIGAVAAGLAVVVAAAPPGVVETAAGLALLGTLVASLSSAFDGTERPEATGVTFLVAASGLSVLGVGAAFWALAAGLLVRTVLPRPTL
jgi:benzoate membrane transport protein